MLNRNPLKQASRFGLALAGLLASLGIARAEEPRAWIVVEDAIAVSLTGQPGDVERGKKLLENRQASLCVLCHSGPFATPQSQGNLAPNLSGVGKRLTLGQLRLRVVDSRLVNPDTIMPSYYRVESLVNVAPKFRGQALLSAEAIEDIVAYLATL